MKLIICDDDLKDAQKANEIICRMSCSKEFEIEIKAPQDVMLEVDEGSFKCDILVIDIQYDKEQYDGIDLTRMVNEKLPSCQIVYLTNVLEFAPFVYETNHCYFVMKENIEIMLPRAIDKAVDGFKSMGNDVIEFLSNGHKVFISQSEIIYIERDDRVLNISTIEKTYPCYTSLRKMEGMLGNLFARCHAGYIVNLSYVAGIDGNEVLLKDGTRLPVGMRFFDKFKMKYLQFYSERM